MTVTAVQDAEPWLTEDDGNLVIYRLGSGKFIGHHISLNEWMRGPQGCVSNVRRWYDCLEMRRRKLAAGQAEDYQHNGRPRAGAFAFQRYWMRRPWRGNNGRWLMRAWV